MNPVHLPTTARRRLALFLGGGLALLCLAPALHASGSRVGFKDAFATARGNAFVATADNPSAIYYNPAGLAALEGTQVSLNLYHLSLSSDYAGPGGTAAMDDGYLTVPSFYTSWKPAGAPWTIGLGVYAPFGLETEWSDASPLRTFALHNRLTHLTWNLSGAWQVSPALSLGAGLTFNQVEADLNRRLGVFGPTDLFRFEGKGDAVGFNLGVLWRASEQHQFGLSYSHRTSVDLRGTSSTVPLVAVEPASARFAFPEVVILGWSFRPVPEWNLEVNLDWTNWNRLDTVTVRKASGDTPLPFHWDSGLFYEFGATRHLAGGWHASFGYCFTENSVPDATYTPAVPDSDRHFYSLGLGFRGAQFTFDLAVQHADGGTRRVTGSPPNLLSATADGTYRNRINAVSLSAGYRF